MDPMQRFRKECTAFFDQLSPEGRSSLVFGDGQSDRPVLMLIGEAPGEQETLQGRPFVGKAGKNLTAFLEVVGLDRQDLYVSNVVKVRPTKRSASGGIVNRPPNREEKLLFTPWLMREIAIVRPDGLVTLGNVALQAFMEETVGNVHGKWQRTVVSPSEGEAFTLPLFPLYHPASVIYNRSLADIYQADLIALRDSLTAGLNLKNDT